MAERLIKPVESNADKRKTYTHELGQYRKAMESDFYLEAMMIVYGYMEDRLRSFLYHCGALAERKSTKVAVAKTRPDILQIVQHYKRDKENDQLGISSITGKIKIVRCLLIWAGTTEGIPDNNKYLKTLKSQLEGTDIGGLLDTLEQIEAWCKYRNEAMHALMNKDIKSLYSELQQRDADGMKLARFIDSQIKPLRYGNRIRRAVNLPIEKQEQK